VTGVGGGLTLRRMRWWDVSGLMPVERACFPTETWSEETFWSELAGWPESRYYVVAELDGALCGYAGLMAVSGEATVQTVAVEVGRRRRGVGAELLAELLAEAVRREARVLWLEVRDHNEPAIALYERHGFERAGVRRGYYDQGRTDAVLMRRRLGSADG
jgi:[ribosomal protein S18]-alanine N-acetyltransferase